ncbi:sentrin-specific protease 6 isoform X2 [Nerophis lumbriciformis]|uniref:sentrin-specific protease 6 isoform X2 n=1 Tax=Nerophis lumbriciformis TaxID=546530 RepID=UPI002ADEFEF7|nr:sentrin-specific protease 6 isoform X2 [Nerophis lumbriciformis]
MNHNRGHFLDALERSEARPDGGYKRNGSFCQSGGSEEEEKHNLFRTSVASTQDTDKQICASSNVKKCPSLKRWTSGGPLRTYKNRSSSHMRPLSPKRLSTATSPPMPSRTNYFIFSPATSQGVVLQGRHFQHAQMSSATRKPVQSLDVTQRNNLTSTQQTLEVDNIVLTCPDTAGGESLNIKRRVQQRRKPLESSIGFPSHVEDNQALSTYQTMCGKCSMPCEDGTKCHNCGNSPACLPCQQGALSSPYPRPPIRSLPPSAPSSGLQQNFYKPSAYSNRPVRAASVNGPTPRSAATSGCYDVWNPPGQRRKTAAQHNLDDPIVLSSDDEMDNASTGSVNRLDSISPQPADSAHSSPAPSCGRVEAAVKSCSEQDELSAEFFEDVNLKIMIPRGPIMKDQLQKQLCSPRSKRSKVESSKCDSIILQCRSVRVGTLRRMVKKPVIFSVERIQLETEGAEQDTTEKVDLQASELISCEWCSVRKLPVLFFQTTSEECARLRTQLNMSQEFGGQWYDCAGEHCDEKYIVLIFVDGLEMKEQMILEDILGEIGRNNNRSNFPGKLPFEEANTRLVNFNKTSKQKEVVVLMPSFGTYAHSTSLLLFFSSAVSPPLSSLQLKVVQYQQVSRICLPAPTHVAFRTRTAARRQSSTFFDDEDEDMADLQPTFSGLVVKLMVYPPPPAKGGISVTNEDLHCLNEGEFLNDVIIDFYLKYLVLEKLKKEDAQRIHVFSSFFYKRLNQRERRNLPETSSLPIHKRRHNRVKTWTRHVDLFQKDFIFVPINESSHWYLAVICFPGVNLPLHEPGSATPTNNQPSEDVPDHCCPLSPNTDLLDGQSEDSRSDVLVPPDEQAVSGISSADPSGPEPQYLSELHRISVSYTGEHASTCSDDQSSGQDECSDDGTPTEDALAANTSSPLKADLCEQPCILIMDSLRGPTRSTVVRTLREYLQVEWEVRKSSHRSFGKDVMKGSSPRVPQQDNFSDCGVYILQYVESFFQNPIASFHLPINLLDWFPQQRMKTKREEIRSLILHIQERQEVDKKELDALSASSEEPEIKETDGSSGGYFDGQTHFPVTS